MDLLRVFSNKTTPKEVAKDRLKLILIHDRGDLAPETLDKIRKEILEVISKYIEIDANDVEISLNRSDDIEGETSPALIANIPNIITQIILTIDINITFKFFTPHLSFLIYFIFSVIKLLSGNVSIQSQTMCQSGNLWVFL